jgi:hypothetical protein
VEKKTTKKHLFFGGFLFLALKTKQKINCKVITSQMKLLAAKALKPS